MSPGPGRRARVAALIKESLAEAIARKLKDPRVGFTTITRVEVTRDISVATVHVSVMGTEEDKTNTLEGLKRAGGFLRTHVARDLTMRTVPQLRFLLDRGLEHYQRIGELLDEAQEGESA